jgi:hypothetical protein
MAVDPLMSQTLPTLVSMGIVSRTAEIALTPRGRRAVAKYRGKSKGKSKRPLIHKGSRGGRYIIRRGRRVYI